MVSMDGEPMARINKKRMAFYLARDLAELDGIEEDSKFNSDPSI